MADKTDDLIISISTDTANIRRALKRLEGDIASVSGNVVKKFDAMGKGIDNSVSTAMQSRINQMVGVATKATKEWNGVLSRQGAELDRLRSKYNPVFAAIKQYQSSVVIIQQAHRLGALSSDEMTSAIQRERKATLDNIAAIKQRNAAVSSMKPLQEGARGYQTANIAAQFQDIAVTSAMGMSPIQIALQQGTQLSAVFNEMGKGKEVLDGIKSAFLSIISPVSLVTIGVIAAGAALFQYISSASGVKSIDDALEENRKKIEEITLGYTEAKRAYEAYISAKGIKSNQDADIEAEARVKSLTDKYKEAQKEAAEYSATLRLYAGRTLGEEVARQANALAKLAEDAGKAGADVGAISSSITKMSSQGFATDALKSWAEGLQASVDGAVKLKNEIGGVEAAASKITPTAEAFSKLQASIDSITSDKAREEVQKLYDKLFNGTLNIEKMRKALGDLSANSPDLQDHISEILRLAAAAANAKAEVDSIWKGASGKGDRSVGLAPKPFNDRFSGNEDLAAQLKRQRDELEKKPKKTGSERQAERDANAYRNLVKSANDRIEQLKLEEQLVGQTGVAAESMRMKLELLQKAQDKGRTVSESQGKEIERLSTAYGEAAEKVAALALAEELRFEREQLFRTPAEQRVYGQLRSAGIDPDSARGQALAGQIRLNEALNEGVQIATDFAQGLSNDLLNSASAMDALKNAAGRLAQMLIEMGTNSVINNLFGNLTSGVFGFGSSPFSNSGQLAGAFASGIGGLWADGGYTGQGGKYEPAGIVHKGEYVVPKNIVERIGVNNIERLMSGYSRGGLVGGPRVPSVPLISNSNSMNGVHVTLGWSKDTDGNIAPIIKDVSQQTFKQGIKQYDKGSAVRTSADLRQVNQRGYGR